MRNQAVLTDVKSCCSQTHPQSKWALIGTAIRIARSLGLHRENTKSNLSLFQMEMRRRLWWHLRVLDFITSMVLNCFESSDSFLDCDTIFPLNISDSELDPMENNFPLEHQGATDMSFCLLRYDVCSKVFTILNQYRLSNATFTPDSVERLIQNVSLHLEKQYLRLFERDPATPLFRLCSIICQHIPTRIRILLSSLEKPLPYVYSATVPFPSLSEIEGNIFISSIDLLDFHVRFPDDQDFDGWHWLFGLPKHWRMVEFMLSQLDIRLRDLDDVSKPQYWDPSSNHYIIVAWEAVEKAFASMSRPKELHDIWRKLETRRNDVKSKLLIANLHP
jgi:Fungal specific transcription factor domain